MRFTVTVIVLFTLSAVVFAEDLPQPEREFRAAWIATVDNIDFPSKRDLTTEQQKEELRGIVKTARDLKLNALVFQVRPHCDALYDSRIEPWSEYLTGQMGKRPTPFFDPLAFLIDEARKNGILLHAWFNPYRALHPAMKGTASEGHITRRRPDLARDYGKYKWLDPTDEEVKKYSLSVVLDVVKRYDIDGVHFDDYFYPYPEKDMHGNEVEFPDDKNWQDYLKTAAPMSRGGVKRMPLKRDDWRRFHVNDFIERVSREVKRLKPQTMFGISPFGIWQPVPERGIAGFNAYAELYADARKWLQDGTIDYLAPQLYWESNRKGLEFPVLLDWWRAQNSKNRHIWPGVAAYRADAYTGAAIGRQVEITRKHAATKGAIFFSFKSLQRNLGGVEKVLQGDVYRREALIPASPWISGKRPETPALSVAKSRDHIKVSWKTKPKSAPFLMVVHVKDHAGWSYTILPALEQSIAFSASRGISVVAIEAVDRLGNISKPAQKKITAMTPP
jgi:uncharacterized lipoprotein YddW (UPF0748 family)